MRDRDAASPVIPEADCLLGRRFGAKATLLFDERLFKGHDFLADGPRESCARAAELNRRFADSSLGFVDAAMAAIGEALWPLRIATTDRHGFQPAARALPRVLLP